MPKIQPSLASESSATKAEDLTGVTGTDRRRVLFVTETEAAADALWGQMQTAVEAGQHGNSYLRFVATSSDAGLALLRASQIDLLIVDQSKPSMWIDFVEQAHEISKTTIVFLLSHSWSVNSLRDAINRGRVFRALNKDRPWPEILGQIRIGALEADLNRSQSALMREASKQNRELEKLTIGLEKTVEDRTEGIARAKELTENQLDQVRHLIRLTKDLSQNISFEEIMSLIRREVRGFAKLGDPILLLQTSTLDFEVLSFRSGILLESRFAGQFGPPGPKATADKALSRKLANLLGRPFMPVMAFPLEVRLIQKYGFESAAAVLCFESSLIDSEQDSFFNEFEKILRPVGMAVDRAFLEREMTIHSLRWERTFDGLRDPIAVIDHNQQVLRSNSKFSDRLIHRKCHQSFAKSEAICQGCPLEKVLATGQLQSALLNIEGRQFQVNSYPIFLAPSQAPSSVVNQYIDVTHSREIYARMLQSEKMSALGLLAGNIAHELNNPLSGIRNLTQVLVAETVNMKNSEGLQADLLEIEKATVRSQKIIRNLLDYSGEGEHEVVLIDLAEVVEKTLPLLKTVLRTHRLNLQLEGRTAKVKVDPHLLQQVVFNLVNNACQAMLQTGQLTIATGVAKEGEGGRESTAYLRVSDSGQGVPQALRDKIFAPFFTTKTEGQGTGLGLSLSRDLVRRFGGELSLKEVGPGACFEVTLPIVSGQEGGQ